MSRASPGGHPGTRRALEGHPSLQPEEGLSVEIEGRPIRTENAQGEFEEPRIGICVCEFEDRFGLGQSKVSYHVRKLKEAGLVREEKRGRWSFYSLERDSAAGVLGEAEAILGAPRERLAEV